VLTLSGSSFVVGKALPLGIESYVGPFCRLSCELPQTTIDCGGKRLVIRLRFHERCLDSRLSCGILNGRLSCRVRMRSDLWGASKVKVRLQSSERRSGKCTIEKKNIRLKVLVVVLCEEA
jgi:hypothetical protein